MRPRTRGDEAMRRIAGFMLLAFSALACSSAPDTPVAAADDKGTVVDLDGLKSKAPTDWKEEKPGNKMRFAQFRLPKVKDDKEDAELVIFKGLGGSSDANIKRWKEQFQPGDAKTEELKIAGKHPAFYLDISGTYLSRFPPFDPNAKIEKKPEYRMLAIHLEGPLEVYHIKLTGPAKTVEHYKKGFDEWLKAFK
jgi:hypothetical protein